MFTCSIISCSNDNSHFFRILFRVSEYWTPASMQSARRSEKLENRKNTSPLPSNYPYASRSLFFEFFALCVEKEKGCKQTKTKSSWAFQGYTRTILDTSTRKKKGEKFTNKFTNEPLKSASKHKAANTPVFSHAFMPH